MIELGTSFGITSAYMASGNPRGNLFTFEGAQSVAEMARAHFQELAIENIELTEGDFNHTLPVFLKNNQSVDFVFIDGNHRREPTLSYFHSLLDKALPSCVFVFDDIHWSSDMEAAWQDIQQHERVTLTIDLFFIGIVYINPDFKEKQHFKIRF
jgi:predicted O-methyltransferase YrrM